ncbi:MAG TPA: VCBS repeat-containing protein, partial [Desulfovibrio sp.]|nr:VCBS repeat-containing protein [Desulfovibrio sp.]
YFVPLRMYAVNFDRDDNWELLVNRPISTASQFFDRYRFFPQGEIHAMYWDGVGLNLQWKTRRIKGSVADFTVGDFNNDGTTDIVLCVNTHPGALGLESRKTMLLAYPLDLAKADPNTAPDKTESEQQ